MLKEFDRIEILSEGNTFKFRTNGTFEEKVKGDLIDLDLNFDSKDETVDWFIEAYKNNREFTVFISIRDETYIPEVKKVGFIVENTVMLIN